LNNLTEFALGTDPTSAKGLDGALAQPRASIVVIEDVEYLQYIANRASNRPEVNYFRFMRLRVEENTDE